MAVNSISGYSWNVFRYLGDYLHFFAVLVVIYTLYKNENCRGLSFKTQLFYCLVFLTRYIDLLATGHTSGHHSLYLLFFKGFYIISSAGIVLTMRRWASTIETNKDTCNYVVILVPCLIVSIVSAVTVHLKSFSVFLWIFSEFLEALAMVPQYILTYRQEDENRRSDKGIMLFICLVGSYRVLYAVNWIYKKIMLGAAYSDPVSWLGGVIEIALFLDFLFNRNFLRSAVLSVDAKINEISQQVELKVFRRQSAPDGELRFRKGANPVATDRDGDDAMLMI